MRNEYPPSRYHQSYHTLYVFSTTPRPCRRHPFIWIHPTYFRRYSITRTRSVCDGICYVKTIRVYEWRSGYDLWGTLSIFIHFATPSRTFDKIGQRHHRLFVSEFAICRSEQTAPIFVGIAESRGTSRFYGICVVKLIH